MPDAPAKQEKQNTGITPEQLAMIMEAANKGNTENLITALAELKKPYVDPKQAENDRIFKENDKANRERKLADDKFNQDNCPHLIGCNSLSDDSGQTSCIAKLRLDAGIVGVCTNCQRVIYPGDPDYTTLMGMKTRNKTAMAGLRTYSNPAAMQQVMRKDIESQRAS